MRRIEAAAYRSPPARGRRLTLNLPQYRERVAGALETSDGRQRLTLNLGYAGGRLTGALDSIDQGVSGAPLEVDLTQSRLRLTQPERDAEFQGMVSADVEAVVGIWSQAGRSHPLTFRRRPGASPSVARP